MQIPQMLMFQLSQQQGGGIYFKMGVSMDLQEHLAVDTVKFIEKFEKTPSPVPEHDDHDHEHTDE